MDGYLTIKEISKKWGLTVRRIQKMCLDGEIPGASKFGTVWCIPENTEKPIDKRIKTGRYINWRKHKEQE